MLHFNSCFLPYMPESRPPSFVAKFSKRLRLVGLDCSTFSTVAFLKAIFVVEELNIRPLQGLQV